MYSLYINTNSYLQTIFLFNWLIFTNWEILCLHWVFYLLVNICSFFFFCCSLSVRTLCGSVSEVSSYSVFVTIKGKKLPTSAFYSKGYSVKVLCLYIKLISTRYIPNNVELYAHNTQLNQFIQYVINLGITLTIIIIGFTFLVNNSNKNS